MSSYYSMNEWIFLKFEKSKRKHKMYSAILLNKRNNKTVRINFGDTRYQNFRDITGLNLYPHLIHNDKNRRRLYRKRHKVFLKNNHYSPSYFSYHILW